MKILGTGLSGLIGSRVTELLQGEYEFEYIDRSHGIDIRDQEKVFHAITSSDASIVFHFAAKTDVDACEFDKRNGKDGEAWQINVLGTQNIVAACKASHKKIIYVSTDFVFDGNAPVGGYTEESVPHPINWYGQTKLEGEKVVMQSGVPFLIIRVAYPYRAVFDGKGDFVKSIMAKLSGKEEIKAVTDHIMTPTFVDDIAWATDTLIETNSVGIYHVVGSEYVSPYQAAHLIADTFGLDSVLINETTRQEFFANRASRPFRLALNNDKIQQLGVKMRTFEEGLEDLEKQINI